MIEHVIPPLKCHATAKRTQERCKRWAVRGAAVCVIHGAGAPQVRAKAAQRVALAEAAARGDRRHPAAILLDTLHLLDTRMRTLLDDSDTGSVAMMEAIGQASALAREALRLQVDERALELQRRQVEDDQAKLVAASLRVALASAGFTSEEQARAEAELAVVLLRVDREGERTVMVEARRLRTPQALA